MLALPWMVALIQVRRHYHLDVAAVTLVASISLGMPVIWLAWATYRESKRSAAQARASLAHVADRLAIAVRAQWEAEAAARRLNDPYPLPVSWESAGPDLADSWDSLLKLASSGAGWPSPPPTSAWAAGPDALAGTGRDLADVLTRVPTGRLVVLGEPGAGKTMLMVRLILDLLARRATGCPVPVLASLASWNPAENDLRGWLAAQLLIDHPALAAPPADREARTQAAALLNSGLILPILDGLDEISEHVRGGAISRINDALRPGERVVVTCRSQQYRDAIGPTGGAEVTLRGAAAVRLRPLDAGVARNYLLDDASGPVARARWEPVLKLVGSTAPVGQALRTPLMVGLARTIYNPRPGDLAGPLREPAELCGPGLADRTAVEALLFDGFISAAYRSPVASPAPRYSPSAAKAEQWMIVLARHLDYTVQSSDFAWWQMVKAVETPARLIFGLYMELTIGGTVGLATWIVFNLRPAFAIPAGLVLALPLALPYTNRAGLDRTPSGGVRWDRRYGFLGLGVMGLPGSLLGLLTGLVFGIPAGILVAVLCLVLGLGEGTGPATSDPAVAASVEAVLLRDRRATLAVGWMTPLPAAIVSGLSFGLLLTPAKGAAIGAGILVLVGLADSFRWTAWPRWQVACAWLALHRKLPWRLMRFLSDAHQRGVLRQVGAVYQFRHIELQHRLASRSSEPPEGS